MTQSFLNSLYSAPEVNPLNLKAKSIPVFNPFDKYGRVFFFSWIGFFCAFLSWYAFPPLLTITIREDLGMTQNDVSNSNIVALLATFLARAICGPLCDRFGPRLVFVGTLLCGSIPTAMAGLVMTPRGLITLRFFVGILGATFVPCQVWCTGFFDKSVVGSANALAGGWGNAGGGVTYFVMPAIFDSLVNQQGLEAHKAWRVAYVVPFIIIISVALGMALTCDDAPSGRWSERHLVVNQSQPRKIGGDLSSGESEIPTESSSVTGFSPCLLEKGNNDTKQKDIDCEIQDGATRSNEVKAEIIIAPTFKEALHVLFSKESMALAGPYACSFGGELAINSILGSYYYQTFPGLSQTGSGHWASMLGLLNIVFRPMGGFIADIIYRHTKSAWAKRIWLTFLGVVTSTFLLAIGLANPQDKATLIGLVTGYAIFMAASNGANFAVVPHAHPFANGIVSGLVGSFGNLGGIIFAIIFRYNSTDYHKSIWIIGAVSMAINLVVCWIAPVPKGQVRGR